MRMDMPGVQVRADDIFISPAQHASCQFLCDLVRQFGCNLSCCKTLHKVMSVVLTVISLGIRVALAYTLSAIPAVGVVGIWWSVPIGWFLADAVGLGYYWWKRRTLFEMR